MKNRIKELRENLNLKQAEIAKATGIDQRTLSNYETEKTNPDGFALVQLADYFNVSIDFLLYRENPEFVSRTKVLKTLNELEVYIEKMKSNID